MGIEEGKVAAESVAHEAAHLSGNPAKHQHMYQGGIGTALGVSTASGVGTYQINRKLAKAQGDVAPPISATTGTTPGLNANIAVAHAKSKMKNRKGGKNVN